MTFFFFSCDMNNDIRFWSINQYSCICVSKGSLAQARFQPRIGQFINAE
ncbi:hypothetical protein RchiOBHm_Chr1g0330921 [Rosa chinensis]|uniref:Uncharacterized protein n=1 Tax=Rosa chinensis TaxID=74649 RepID=A0A2P6SBD1_ROSCH|nr:hypothetical protein RchiOBHm_Chr1g0330921 [Rosa chinensis]